ncbi:MAG: recombination mediator RecR [Candidatus Omnitrophica bacterium]|nr:recombination mediator RecR [Candidatus Omnitrophota bacterium]MCM8826322.1 recombination mediator RecR [Candidatus Omnitrophota bacterium]
MSGGFPNILEELIEKLEKLPGIGRRSAQRLAFHLLKISNKELDNLVNNIIEAHRCIKPCNLCNNFSTNEICQICANPKRDRETICIVETPQDVLAIEKTAQYQGLYYVILGALSPLEGVGPGELNIGKLLNRLSKGEIKEVIISTDPDNEGELTAQFLIEKISKYKVKIYRISIGIPLGTQIEYIDPSTLGKAIIDRRIVI